MTASIFWTRLQRPLILLAMQSCWLYAWLAVVEQAAIGQKAVATTVVLLLVIGAAWRQILVHFVRRRVLAEILYWIALPIVAALATKVLLFPDAPFAQSDWLVALPRAFAYLLYETRPAELLLAVGSAAAWYLGGRSSGGAISYEQLLGQFQLGIVMLFMALLVGYGLESLVPRAGLLVVCFFAVALAGIASARSTEEQSESQRPGHVTTSVVTLVVIVSGLGILIGAIATPGLIDALVGAVKYVAHLLGEIVAFLASLLPQPEFTPSEPSVSTNTDDSALREFYKSIPVPEILRRGLFIVWVVVVMGTLLVALWRICAALLERLRRGQPDSGEERESLENGFLADLLALLHILRTRIGTLARGIQTAWATRLRGREPTTSRAVYLRFLGWAAKKVARREPWQSPHEYSFALAGLIPDAALELAYITDNYVQARYGGREPSRDTVEQMARAIEQIKKAHKTRPTPMSRESQEGLQ